jgi:hypothetical protein
MSPASAEPASTACNAVDVARGDCIVVAVSDQDAGRNPIVVGIEQLKASGQAKSAEAYLNRYASRLPESVVKEARSALASDKSSQRVSDDYDNVGVVYGWDLEITGWVDVLECRTECVQLAGFSIQFNVSGSFYPSLSLGGTISYDVWNDASGSLVFHEGSHCRVRYDQSGLPDQTIYSYPVCNLNGVEIPPGGSRELLTENYEFEGANDANYHYDFTLEYSVGMSNYLSTTWTSKRFFHHVGDYHFTWVE